MRVVAGSVGGRTLRSPAGTTTRPTEERVRAALFDRLGDAVAGVGVIDPYAGSGALGIEALSRGAGRAVFVEVAPAALRALRRNVGDLGLEARARVLAEPARRALDRLAREGARFELALIDPPYALPWSQALDGLACVLAPGAWVVVERAARDPAPAHSPGLRPWRRARYGEVELSFWRYGQDEEDAADAGDLPRYV